MPVSESLFPDSGYDDDPPLPGAAAFAQDGAAETMRPGPRSPRSRGGPWLL